MNCASCGSDNEPGRKFCGECGARLAVSCPACGSPNAPGVKFCGECGASLGEHAPVPTAALALQREAPETERRLVSVFFADLVGFTTLSEARDAEEVRDLLSRYLGAIGPAGLEVQEVGHFDEPGATLAKPHILGWATKP